MRISAIELNNFRCFANVRVELSKGINLIIGSNNSGKSTLLKSVAWLQEGAVVSINDLRTSEKSGSVKISLSDALQFFSKNSIESIPNRMLEISQDISIKADISRSSVEIDYEICPIGSNPIWVKKERGKSIGLRDIPQRVLVFNEDYLKISNVIPKNFIQPYLSRRKVSSYSEKINSSALNTVTGDFSNLYAKIDYLSNSQVYGHKQYIEACVDILGFPVTSTYSERGKKAGYLMSSLKNISTPIFIDSMGEGVPNLLGLIVDLCLVDNKLFLIEEPENDIHPKALKKLLKLIAEKSDTNQFIITTHSNIVVKYLGSQSENKLFRVKTGFEEEVPTSTIEEVDNSVEARLEVLEELGYEFVDFDMWSGWLILEEASAEKIIRKYLIPWFTPELNGKLKTFSARSLSEVKKKFEDFNNLFVFLYLQPVYKNLAWVVIDAGDKEEKIINELKDLYTPSGWNKENFLQFSEHDFEQYYPGRFKSQVNNILKTLDKQKRRKMKNELLEEVEHWIKENDGYAKEAFKESASNVIEVLLQIKSILFEPKNFK
jgi:predicted ATPase